MANGSIVTTLGKHVILNRSFKSTPDYTAMSKFKIGISNGTPNVADTNLDVAIPISNGTVNDDGSNNMTGSSGGDNSTNNTSRYKEGAGVSDATAQNLIANNGNATKIWTIADLSSAGTNITATKPFGLWVYIKDATAYNKLLSAGTALEIKLGSDTSNYYSYTRTAAQLSTGWNWVTSNTVNVEDLTETGTVAGNVDTFIIEIVTNNATDTFAAGDVVYDLLRTWATSDLTKTYVTNYPALDETNLEVEIRGFITSVEANGFDVNGYGDFNTDSTNKFTTEDTFTAESKSSTDQFTFVSKIRII